MKREIVLFVPSTAKHWREIVKGARTLARSVDAELLTALSLLTLESTVRMKTVSVVLAIAPDDLGELGAAIGRVREERGTDCPLARVVILANGDFPPGTRPESGVRLFEPSRSRDARMALAVALDEAADEAEALSKPEF